MLHKSFLPFRFLKFSPFIKIVDLGPARGLDKIRAIGIRSLIDLLVDLFKHSFGELNGNYSVGCHNNTMVVGKIKSGIIVV